MPNSKRTVQCQQQPADVYSYPSYNPFQPLLSVDLPLRSPTTFNHYSMTSNFLTAEATNSYHFQATSILPSPTTLSLHGPLAAVEHSTNSFQNDVNQFGFGQHSSQTHNDSYHPSDRDISTATGTINQCHIGSAHQYTSKDSSSVSQLEHQLNLQTSTSGGRELNVPSIKQKNGSLGNGKVQLEQNNSSLHEQVNCTASSQECPICRRTFVYGASFIKHVNAASCHPLPKKSRLDQTAAVAAAKIGNVSSSVPFSNSSIMGNPQSSVSRSNSTRIKPARANKKNLRRSSSLSRAVETKDETFVQTSLLRDCTATENRETSVADTCAIPLAASNDHNFGLLQGTSVATFAGTMSQLNCNYCSLIISDQLLYQRHRLAHALLPQLHRNLKLAAINEDQQQLAIQVDNNFSDKNWVRWFIGQVELTVCNVDHVVEGVDLNNIVEFLVKQSLDWPDRNAILHSTPTTANTAIDPPSYPIQDTTSYSTAFYTGSESFDPYVANLLTPEAFVEELSVVERQMEKLLSPYSDRYVCSECGRLFPDPERVFQHMCRDHPLDFSCCYPSIEQTLTPVSYTSPSPPISTPGSRVETVEQQCQYEATIF